MRSVEEGGEILLVWSVEEGGESGYAAVASERVDRDRFDRQGKEIVAQAQTIRDAD